MEGKFPVGSVKLSSKVANAQGEIGFWAKDLSDAQLTNMFGTILRIRWYERTLVDKMLQSAQAVVVLLYFLLVCTFCAALFAMHFLPGEYVDAEPEVFF